MEFPTALSVSRDPGRLSVSFALIRANSSAVTGRSVQYGPQLLVDLYQRLLGLVGLDWRIDDERPLRARAQQAAACSISPMLVFAQIHIEPRAEGAAKVVIHSLNGDFLRRVRRHVRRCPARITDWPAPGLSTM